MRQTVFLFALLLLGGSVAAAEEPDLAARPSLLSTLQTDGRLSFAAGRRVTTSPTRFGYREWGIAAAVAGGVALSSLADQPLRDYAQAHRSTRSGELLSPFDHYGSGMMLVPLIGGMYLGGLVFSQPWLHETGRSALTAVVLASLTTTLLKMTLGRQRPYLNHGHAAFGWFQLKSSSWSFPSGHTTAAFAMSSALASRIDHPAATVALYSLAALTAAQRIHDDKHWLSDVLLGASIGTGIGWVVARHRPRLDTRASTPSRRPLMVALNSNPFGVRGEF